MQIERSFSSKQFPSLLIQCRSKTHRAFPFNYNDQETIIIETVLYILSQTKFFSTTDITFSYYLLVNKSNYTHFFKKRIIVKTFLWVRFRRIFFRAFHIFFQYMISKIQV